MVPYREVDVDQAGFCARHRPYVVIIKLVVESVKKQLSVQENIQVRKHLIDEMAVIIKLIAASIKRQLSVNIRVRKHLLDEMAKMKVLQKKRKVHEELLTHEINVLMKKVQRELLLKVQAIPAIDEEEKRIIESPGHPRY
ncbi:uncharacterized protein LOC130048403 [Ostrea edulis]|uniref:uncharacterized protein LOC130048403 n=1 Tax=Ostrea edulis TaxID=37623 RepID=UPI0024AF3F5E|nr:uncharacterized protein LOC130048403 [Ostrea edulis]XP_056001036.1 uncharacterized protein LOC130048403 [Ostrea edulis]XP_056001037.1 uncharacterized protein LOC130048403 [Ostrea edulis]XP_056001038.1 uncharacterized protein LOC130048403 [Ostrea edulis]